MRVLLRLSPALIVIVVAVAGPYVTPYQIDESAFTPYAEPGGGAVLGADQLGRDVLSRLLAGGRELLVTSVLIAVIVTALAALLGAVAALRPGVGTFIERMADMLIMLPVVLGMLLIVLAWPGGGQLVLVGATVVLGLPYAVRVVAAASAPVAASGYVEVAVSQGERLWPLVWREVLPNLRTTLLTLLGLRFVEAVYVVTTAAFLEIGPQPPEANWALMVRENAAGILLNPWAVIAPSLAIGALAIGVSLAADALAPATVGPPIGRRCCSYPGRLAGPRMRTRGMGGDHIVGPVVRVHDLTVSDHMDRVVLAGAELTVERGQVVALVGPSGAGKTTMLRAVVGALPAALRQRSGSVHVLGRSVPDLSAQELRSLRRAQIGFVGQDPASRLNPRMRVHRLLAEVAALGNQAARGDPAALGELLTEVRLPATADLLRRRPGQLSGGQQRRVALARALARRPALLLLDEPTAGMDAALRDEIGVLLGELATRHELAIAMACHDEKLVDQIADSVVEFEHYGAPRTPAPASTSVVPATTRTGNTCVLSVRGLSAWIGKPGGPAIIRDADLDLPAGSALAIVGPSGSGKTTLVRAIAGLHHPVTGQLELAGAPLELRGSRRSREQHRRIQLVPQDPLGTLNPSQRIGTAIARPLLLHQRATKADAPRRVTELLAQVGLPEDFTERYPHELSGGQRQRVAIARAIAAEPDVLLCDEITSALDPQTTEAVMQLLARLRIERGLGLLLISHDLPLVTAHTEATLLVQDGTCSPGSATTT